MLSYFSKAFAAKTVVDGITHNRDLVLESPFFDHELLIFSRLVGISVKNRYSDVAYGIFTDRDSKFRMLSAFSRHDNISLIRKGLWRKP